MHKRIAIGLIVLIFVLGVAIVFYHQHTDIQQLKKELAQDKKRLEGYDTPTVYHGPSTSDAKPTDVPGFVWVRHGDHWDLVARDASHSHEGSNADEVPQDVSATENDDWLDPPPSGHWSDNYLPPMAELEVMYAGDEEATYILERTKILLKYGKGSHHPDALKAFVELYNYLNQLTSKLGTDVPLERLEELVKLQWPLLNDPPKGWEGSKYLIKGEE